MSLPFAIQSVPSRRADAEALAEQLPGARTFEDTSDDYMTAYIGMLREYAGTPFVRLEDDVTLCRGFVRRITAAVGLHRQTPINFFYLGNKNRSRRPERHGGSDYCMGQCHYFPGWLSAGMIRAYDAGRIPNRKRHGGKTGVGFITSDYLVSQKKGYILWYPSLVQHRDLPSAIANHPARHSKRQSRHFADDIEI